MLLDLSHYIFLFKMHQSSSFNLHCTAVYAEINQTLLREPSLAATCRRS